MILYGNRAILRQLFEINGSVINHPKTLMRGLTLAGLSIFCVWLHDTGSSWAPRVPNTFAFSAIGSILAFATVFRTSLGWQKYWEALGDVNTMYSKWLDVFTQYSVFARTTVEVEMAAGTEESNAKARRVLEIYNNVHKHFSLLSALAADRLLHGDLEIMNRRAEMGRWKDKVSTRTRLGRDLGRGDPKGISARALPEFKERVRGAANNLSNDKLSTAAVHGSEEVARARSLLGTESAIDGPIVWTKEDGWTHCYLIEELPSMSELKALESTEDRVNMVTAWILSGLAMTSKDLDVAPPIQSRMYQELSNASLAFLNSVKIADTPFPFSYAQVLVYVLIVFACFIPVSIAAFTESYIVAPVVSFVLFLSFWSINEVALDLETPFGNDLNDMPLDDFHRRFTQSLAETHEALNVVHGGKVDGVSDEVMTIGGTSSLLIASASSLDQELQSPSLGHELSKNLKDSKSKSAIVSVPEEAEAEATPQLEVTIDCDCFGEPLDVEPDDDSLSVPRPDRESFKEKGAARKADRTLTPQRAEDPNSLLRQYAVARAAEKAQMQRQLSPVLAGGAALPAPDADACDGGAASPATEVIDRGMAEVGEKMERHLAKIASEIDDLLRRVEKSSCK